MTCNEHRNLCGIIWRAHLHVKYLCDKVVTGWQVYSSGWCNWRNRERDFSWTCSWKSEEALKEFLLVFLRRTQDPPLVQSMAKLIQLLVGDAPISSVVPFMYHHHLLDICSSVINGGTEYNNLQKMK